MTEVAHTNPQIVWTALLDNAWQCQVHRTGEYTGQLTVKSLDGSRTLLEAPVTLSYQAMFGPDVGDVSIWEELATQAVDAAILDE